MKSLLSFLCLFLSLLSMHAADTIQYKVEVKNVRFFLEGAQLEYQINATFPKGDFVVRLSGLPTSIDPESIRITSSDKLRIHSIEPKINTNQLKKSVYDSVAIETEAIGKEKINVNNQLQALSEELTFLKSNYNIKGTETLSKERLQLIADFYGQRMLEIKKKQTQLNFELEVLDERLSKINQRVAIRQQKKKTYAELYVMGESEIRFSEKIQLTCFLPNAGWYPVYDLYVDNTNEPMRLVHKAVINQKSGQDWKNIKLGISNANPVQTNIKPELVVWYTNQYKPNYGSGKRRFTEIEQPGSIKGKVTDAETAEPVPFANVILELEGSQVAATTTDFDGNYTLRSVETGNYDLIISSVGYQKKVVSDVYVNANRITFLDIALNGSYVQLDEVVVTNYRERSNRVSNSRIAGRSSESVAETVGGVYAEDRSAKISSKTHSGVVASALTNRIDYSFDKKYDLPQGNVEKYIEYKTSNIPATFTYYVMPEFADEAFLVAEVVNWSQIRILKGQASVFFEDTWVGSVPLSETAKGDTMQMSIARDPQITVKKELLSHKINHSIMGKAKDETFTYEYFVQNAKSQPVELTIEDQIPVSVLKDKKVDLVESSGAEYVEEKGFLKWKLKMEAGGAQKLVLTYRINF